MFSVGSLLLSSVNYRDVFVPMLPRDPLVVPKFCNGSREEVAVWWRTRLRRLTPVDWTRDSLVEVPHHASLLLCRFRLARRHIWKRDGVRRVGVPRSRHVRVLRTFVSERRRRRAFSSPLRV